MLLSLLGVAAATHVTTFDLDPSYTKTPFSGLESLVVEPTAALAQLKPIAGVMLPTAERTDNESAAGERTLAFTNPGNNWAEVAINELPLGIIGPYAQMKLQGLRPGDYRVTLKYPTGFVRDFAVRVLPKAPGAPTTPLDIQLGEDRIVVNHRVEFGFDSAELLPVSQPILVGVAKVLAEHPELEVLRVEGHTDAQGTDEYNQKLSEQRAASVVAALVKLGVAPERLHAAGFGESKPLDAADTEEAWEKNRRVDFVVEKRTPPPPPEPAKGKKKGR